MSTQKQSFQHCIAQFSLVKLFKTKEPIFKKEKDQNLLYLLKQYNDKSM